MSNSYRCVLNSLTPGQSELVLKDVVDNSKFDFVENEVVLACRNMQKTVKTLDPEQAENAIDMIKVNHQNKQIKIACAIALSVMNQTDRLYAVGEATLIIESLRPFLLHCVLSQLKGVEGEWYITINDCLTLIATNCLY